MIRLTITHIYSGQEISSEMPVSTEYPGARNQSQAFGSAVTYAKKYLYWGLYGLANADDDGQAVDNTDSSLRGKANSPVSEPLPPKDADLKRREAIHNDLQEIYKEKPSEALRIIDSFTDENKIEKGKFNILQVKTHEQILFFQKEISKYKLDKQKTPNGN